MGQMSTLSRHQKSYIHLNIPCECRSRATISDKCEFYPAQAKVTFNGGVSVDVYLSRTKHKSQNKPSPLALLMLLLLLQEAWNKLHQITWTSWSSLHHDSDV